MAKKKKGGFIASLPFIFFLLFIAPDLLEILFSIGVDILGLLIFLGILVAPVAIIVGIIKLIIALTKKKDKTATASTTNKDLLDGLSSYFKDNEELAVRDNITILCTNKNSNALTSYDIFLDDEYISDLATFSKAYPGGFNNFANLILLKTKPKKLSRKEQKELEKQEALRKQEEALKKTTQALEKNCGYYINDLTRLNDKIPNERISASLNQTVEYLKEIQKIENEFPESKDKTKKLYQYYLPMLSDILQNYNRLANNTTKTEEFKTNEDRLAKTIILINGALKNISSTLMEDYYTDLKVDMKTLESILKKDGLIEELEDAAKEK